MVIGINYQDLQDCIHQLKRVGLIERISNYAGERFIITSKGRSLLASLGAIFDQLGMEKPLRPKRTPWSTWRKDT